MVSLVLLAVLQATPVRATITPTDVQLAVGRTVAVSGVVFDARDTRINGLTIVWSSTAPDVASVNPDGRVTAISPGETRIVALVGGRPLGFSTIVVPQLPASRVVVTVPTTTIPVGTSVPATVTAFTRLDDQLSGFDVTFETDAPEIVFADRFGRVHARREGRATVTASVGSVRASVTVTTRANPTRAYTVEPNVVSDVRTGDVIRFQALSDADIGPLYPLWTVVGPGAQIEGEDTEGIFVADTPGEYRVVALIGEQVTSTATVRVTQRHIPATLTSVGRGAASTHHSGDTWVFEGVDGRDYAYIGTYLHDWMKVWDVTNPSNPVLTDSLQLDARRINDVKIHPNNRVGIVTREGASNRRNGMVLLDLSTPAHPTILSEYTETLTGGVHNVWIEPNNMVYAAHNGTSEIHIIDIQNPRAPREVGRWGLASPMKTLHDVIVQDGYAYLSYWNDGVVMLDVGAGSHGGTPTQPRFVSQFAYPIGNTHVAWRAGRYLFIGDEIFPPGWDADAPIEARGYIHVVDYADPERPREVARYEVPEAGAHNVWVEGDRLYVGYYQGGLRVLDISGELRGDLYRQGREIASLKTTDANSTVPNWPMTWGAQIHKGYIYTSDLNSGLWILKLDERVIVP